MTTRRALLIALGAGALAAPLRAPAQAPKQGYRVGILYADTLATGLPLMESFKLALRELGYVEGRNIAIDRHFADGNLRRLPVLVAELVQQKVDVVVADAAGPAQAAQRDARRLPLVFVNAADPVRARLVASLERPGGNATGIASDSQQLSLRRLQLLREAFPKIARVVVLASGDFTSEVELGEVKRAAGTLGIEVASAQVVRREDFEAAFSVLRSWRAEALLATESSENFANRNLLVEFAAQAKLPAIYAHKAYAESGGLISYGASYEALYRRAAVFVDRILKGAKPGELPVETPAQFELAVNAKTAKALGAVLPKSMLARAGLLIE